MGAEWFEEEEFEPVGIVRVETERSIWLVAPERYQRLPLEERPRPPVVSIQGRLADGSWHGLRRCWWRIRADGERRLRVLPTAGSADGVGMSCPGPSSPSRARGHPPRSDTRAVRRATANRWSSPAASPSTPADATHSLRAVRLSTIGTVVALDDVGRACDEGARWQWQGAAPDGLCCEAEATYCSWRMTVALNGAASSSRSGA